jgi:DNA polymerase-3 subunit gamma/tau
LQNAKCKLQIENCTTAFRQFPFCILQFAICILGQLLRTGSGWPMTEPDPSPARSDHRYVVIARRYRPQSFDELVGQEHIARALQQAIAGGRVGHAYLFTGARGVGKTSAARILAKALNCQRGPTPAPCNDCDVCLRVSSGDDVDVLEIDGASNRGIDEIRQLRQNVAVRPSRVRYKIYIIDEVHMLTKEAFNALLKTLEEPPEHVKFIFATTEPQKIPITILSRCQRFDFAGISPAAIQARLLQIAAAEGVALEPEAVQILASRAAGSMRDSQSLLEQLLAVGHDRITADDVNHLLGIAPAERLGGLVRHLVARDAAAALADVDATLRDGVEVGLLVDQLIGYFRDVMTVAAGCNTHQMLYALPSQANEVIETGRQLGLSTVLAIGQILDQTAARMRVSVHGRTLVEMAVVRICQLGELDELAAAVAELRGMGSENGTSHLAPPAATAKKNGEPHPLASQRTAPPAEAIRTTSRPSEPIHPIHGRLDPPHTDRDVQSAASAEIADTSPDTTDSVLAQWQRAVSAGHTVHIEAPPRASRREQLAAIADRPIVRRAMELFDVPAGHLRYTPPDGQTG